PSVACPHSTSPHRRAGRTVAPLHSGRVGGITGNVVSASSALVPPPTDSEIVAMSTSPTARMPRAQRRAQLLELATRMFTEHGFQATSMDHIATAAGVTKPVLYQHFESKETLYIEVLDLIAAGMIDEVRDVQRLL